MNIMEEVKRVVKELGEKNIRKVGSTEFEDAKNNKVCNRYFTGDIYRWMSEKVSVALWLNLNKGPKKRIIDLGTGAGWFVYYCRLLGHECYGTDILNRPEYEAGYDFLGIEVLGDLTRPMEKMNLDGKFDYITTMRSFIGQRPNAWSKDEWKFFFEDMYDHLNDEGALYIDCNSGSKLDNRYKRLPLDKRSYWGDIELNDFFKPYLIDSTQRKNQAGRIRSVKTTIYITKEQIPDILKR
jgi:hypothetical protein